MRVLACPCSFKEALTAKAVASILGAVTRDFHHTVEEVPLADGGEGLIDALSTPMGLNIRTSVVRGMYGDKVGVRWASAGTDAYLEAAECVGLALTPRHLRDPLRATTVGLGDLVVEAARSGARRVYVGLGGTGTVDGGLEMRRAIQAAGVTVELVGLVDVDVPLAGARMFIRQKLGSGQRGDVVDELDKRLLAMFDPAVANVPGAGAAGGLGAAILAIGGRLERGAAFVVDAVGLDARVAASDVVLTGEGRIDEQTEHGKAVSAVVELCRKHEKRCVAFCGQTALDAWPGVDIRCITPPGQPLEEAIAGAETNLREAAADFFRSISI